MARIAFWLAPLAGPINASRPLARDLRARGHDVIYIGTQDCRQFVDTQTYRFIPVFERWFPLREPGAAAPPPPRQGRRRVNPAKVFFQALLSGEADCLDRVLTREKPDLLLLPSCFRNSTMCALIAHRAGVPSIYLTSIFLRPADWWAGPLQSAHVPTGTMGSALAATLAWARADAIERVGQALMWMVHGMNIRTFTRTLARQCGYPLDLLTWRDGWPRIVAPEIVLYPQCFDVPGGEHPNRIYGSAGVDPDRSEPDFPYDRLQPDLPIVLCAMGTVRYVAPQVMQRFYQAVIDAVAAIRPPHQLVMATGTIDPAVFARVTDRVLLAREVPQLALLRRAAVMITHGGANSARECAYFGVPLVIFPIAFDQPATVARVRFHGLGLAGSFRRATPDRIRALVERALHVPYFRFQAQAMSARLQQFDGAQIEVRAIEGFLNGKGSISERNKVMSDLVTRLSEGDHRVEVSLRPEATPAALKESIESGYVHLKFPETRGGTDLYVPLVNTLTETAGADFDGATGSVRLVGELTLDYIPVRCIATIQLDTMAGRGRLERVAS